MKKYTNDQKQAIVNRYYSGEQVNDLSMEFDVPRSTLYFWISKLKPVIKSDTFSAKDYRKLSTKLERQAQIIEILRSVECCAKSPLKLKLIELEKLYGKYSNHILCEALCVDRGTFLNHIKRRKGDNAWFIKRREEMGIKIKQLFEDNHQVYGAQKIAAILRSQGETVSDRFVSSIMKDMNLKSIRTTSKKEYLSDRHRQNIIKQKFDVNEPNKVWASDLTYFKYNNRFYYICAIIDLFSRKIIAHKISKTNSTQLTKSVLMMAMIARKPAHKLIFHSDNGSNYISKTFEKILADNDITHSLSRPGNPHDNAVCESFFSSMKREELYRRKITSETMLYKIVDDYINFYNSERPHATLNYKTPNAFEQEYHELSE